MNDRSNRKTGQPQRSGPVKRRPGNPARATGGSRHRIHLDPSVLTVWQDRDLVQFKVAEIEVQEWRSNQKVEAAARAHAADIKAEVSYAYSMARPVSTSWWQIWGGYNLDEEILRAAVCSRQDVAEQVRKFDPKDNDYGVETVEDFQDIMVHVHHESLEEEDFRRGFNTWFRSIPPAARMMFAQDFDSWRKPRDPSAWEKPVAKIDREKTTKDTGKPAGTRDRAKNARPGRGGKPGGAKGGARGTARQAGPKRKGRK